jgi:hypothetical protein
VRVEMSHALRTVISSSLICGDNSDPNSYCVTHPRLRKLCPDADCSCFTGPCMQQIEIDAKQFRESRFRVDPNRMYSLSP